MYEETKLAVAGFIQNKSFKKEREGKKNLKNRAKPTRQDQQSGFLCCQNGQRSTKTRNRTATTSSPVAAAAAGEEQLASTNLSPGGNKATDAHKPRRERRHC
jgi:hypothetical protein